MEMTIFLSDFVDGLPTAARFSAMENFYSGGAMNNRCRRQAKATLTVSPVLEQMF